MSRLLDRNREWLVDHDIATGTHRLLRQWSVRFIGTRDYDEVDIRMRREHLRIGHHLDIPVVSISPEDAGEHFTWLAGFLGLDSPASSALTRELLAWEPTHLGLIDDLDQGHYFHTPAA